MLNETTKPILDTVSVGVVLATLASWLPAIAAFFTILWTVIRIYETKTVQDLLLKRKKKKCKKEESPD